MPSTAVKRPRPLGLLGVTALLVGLTAPMATAAPTVTASGSKVFSQPGEAMRFAVPKGVTKVTVKAIGGGGGGAGGGSQHRTEQGIPSHGGGGGATVTCIVDVTRISTLYVRVGGGGVGGDGAVLGPEHAFGGAGKAGGSSGISAPELPNLAVDAGGGEGASTKPLPPAPKYLHAAGGAGGVNRSGLPHCQGVHGHEGMPGQTFSTKWDGLGGGAGQLVSACPANAGEGGRGGEPGNGEDAGPGNAGRTGCVVLSW